MPRPSPSPLSDTPIGSGLWRIDGDVLVPPDGQGSGPARVLVPTEDVLILTADLPLPSARRRREAAPFAIEDRIAQPLALAHVAVGAVLSGTRHLIGVATRERMECWTGLLADHGLDLLPLVPDALVLPLPSEGAWSVDLAAGRAVVRAADGTGFAVPLAHFGSAWIAAGRPRLLSYGEALPSDFPADAGDAVPIMAVPPLDLRQGDYASARRSVSPLWRRVAIVAAAGALAHAAIAAADTLALDHLAATKAAETRALVQQVAPDATLGDDLAGDVANILPAAGAASSFLPLLQRVTTALKPLAPAVHMRSIAYDAAAGTMNIEMEAPTLAALQQVGGTLSSAGLSAQPGAAAQSGDHATGAFLIRGTS